ncbi:transposase [Desmonostoc muscorum CCALA 125]|nr:transposase [Desmonostoc muscorum CCALA 125]
MTGYTKIWIYQLIKRYNQDGAAGLANKRHQNRGRESLLTDRNRSLFHRSNQVKQYWQCWQQQGLYIFFLPPYSPQMNRIEDEWLHLKRHELSSQIFDDEYEKRDRFDSCYPESCKQW